VNNIYSIIVVRMNLIVYIICFTVLNSQSSNISEMFVVGSVVGSVIQFNVLTVNYCSDNGIKNSWTSPFVSAFKMCTCHWANSTHLKNTVILSDHVLSHNLSPLGLCKLISDLISC